MSTWSVSSLSLPVVDNYTLLLASWRCVWSWSRRVELFLSDLTVSVFTTGLAVGLDPEGYGNPDFCWISIYDKLLWSFAGPIAIVILVRAVDLTKQSQCFNPNEPQGGIICRTFMSFMFLLPDQRGDFHDCSQDFLQSLSEGNQEASCYVSTSC